LIVHETVEIRLLLARGIDPFKLSTVALQRTLAAQSDAHVQAILDEHGYLQEYIARHYKQFFQIGTLLKVNRDDEEEADLQLLLESEVGVVIIETDKLTAAGQIIAALKGESP
jgi:hypothetical protein